MAVPCAPPVPILPGLPQPAQFQQLPQPPVRLDPIGNIVVAEPPAPPQPPPPPPTVVTPSFVSELPLSNPWVLAWLATLTRATYSPNGALFDRAARAVSSAFTTSFTANSPDSPTPGYGVVHLPRSAIVVVSGTTNEGQWFQQLLNTSMVEWPKTDTFGVNGGLGTMAVWKAAAISIGTAIAAIPAANQILWVGHSMGAAVATLLHAVMPRSSAARAPGRLVTFASPKPGDARLATLCRTGEQVYKRLWITGDLVPSLPPDISLINFAVPDVLRPVADSWALFRHPAPGLSVDTVGNLSGDEDETIGWQLAVAIGAVATGQPLSFSTAHSMVNFASRLTYNCLEVAGATPTNWTSPIEVARTNVALTSAGL